MPRRAGSAFVSVWISMIRLSYLSSQFQGFGPIVPLCRQTIAALGISPEHPLSPVAGNL
jgi:hypothetical protein